MSVGWARLRFRPVMISDPAVIDGWMKGGAFQPKRMSLLDISETYAYRISRVFEGIPALLQKIGMFG